MSWKKSIEELRRRESLAREMGGPDKVKRQHDHGKLTIRERIDALIDPASFHETGALAGKASYDERGEISGFTPSNFVFGQAAIDGRPVIVSGDDFTVRGGAADASIIDKRLAAERMASENRLPVIRLVDGSGGGGSVKTLEDQGYSPLPGNLQPFVWLAENLSAVPVVSIALGSVAGMGAAQVTASHYSLIVKGTAQMFVAGPPLVARAGETVSREDLGGSAVHVKTGAIDDEAESEEDAFERTRRFLSYLPATVHDVPPRGPLEDDAGRREEWLIDAIPENRRKVYRMRPIVEALVDEGSFFEIGRQWGLSIITGLARLDGWPVLLMAGDPFHYGGGWTADACQKVTRAVDLAETFHLPIVYLLDCPGFVIGSHAERQGTIRFGVRALTAIQQSTVPWCTIVVRRAFGVAGAANSPAHKIGHRYAWPSGDWGPLPLEGGIEAAYRGELDQAEDYGAKLAEIEERLNRVRSPFRTAEAYRIEEIIDPRDTRPILCQFANLAAPLRTPGRPQFGTRP